MISKFPTTIAAAVSAALFLATAHGQDGDRKKRPHVEPDLTKLPPASKQAGVTFAKDIRPLLEASCFRCHGEEKQKGDLRLDSLEAVLKGGEDGKIVAVGDSAKSSLLVAVAQIDDETAMPPKRRPGSGPGGGGPGGPGGFGPPPRAGGPPPPPNAGAPGDAPKAGPAPEAPKPPTGPDGKPLPPRGGPGGPGGFGGPGGPGGPMAKALTPEQVGLVRAWID